MKNLSKYIKEEQEWINIHRIDEMAQISRPSDELPRNAEVWVYGENDEPGTKTPHIHIKIDNGEIELEVSLQHLFDLNIWRTTHNYPKSWDGLSKVKKAVRKWLQKTHKKFNVTNAEYIVQVWNDNNPSNEIDDEFIK